MISSLPYVSMETLIPTAESNNRISLVRAATISLISLALAMVYRPASLNWRLLVNTPRAESFARELSRAERAVWQL